ncbi:RNA 2',3'-cyclic phosphodiesterase [Paenibacillus apiarius]|uniref:RNA 2',3'-cyclic phosphodiesterase n=1 Tax=Paenibacillus apiarius TaxID=46240 RepID=A0ABT4DQ02_9BACL|nr:RNA 2',3'-cyclic phosphodiesterase [Paenibacillus apiarius]MCY9518030.1 RNA 2',3'-cyclic phosphodiesterase [Paenibacillus apiarius]MCY9518343.1 RNA 2',3'-cyclic phosphodiesterase [Paenibacillus apiarius]MCY9551256.1 RNA 2',3'-cyclic phosphodiesterase [Paenibacillus apiarius]MCY9558410.1 RNA 2',3'-cyclic phosphodiesterase [Paenibacillus apiarius]MCY9684810.1 RNA 2',3'-cyclic phosphodiesterase [Paenibacillus apiarius]
MQSHPSHHRENQPDDKQRLFVAIPLPTSAAETVIQWSEGAKRQWAFHKWVHPLDLHITVQFLGAVSPVVKERLIEGLEKAAQASEPFRLELKQAGTFGASEAPRVLWAGVGGEIEHLKRLYDHVVAATAPLGFMPEERPYRPHITLARKYRGTAPMSMNAAHAPLPEHDWKVDRLVLYRTRMGKTPMYERVEEFALDHVMQQ